MSEQQQPLSVTNDTTDTTDTTDTSEITVPDDTVKVPIIGQKKKAQHSTQDISNGHAMHILSPTNTTEHETVAVEAEDPQKTLKMPALRRTTHTLPLEHGTSIEQTSPQPSPALVPSPVQDQNIFSLPPTTSHSNETFFSFSETDVDILDIISHMTYSFISYEAISVIPQAISMDNEHPLSVTQDFSEIDVDSTDTLMLPEHTHQYNDQHVVGATFMAPLPVPDIDVPNVVGTSFSASAADVIDVPEVVGTTFMAPVVPVVEDIREKQEAQEQPADPIELPETPHTINTSIPLTPLPEPVLEQAIPAVTTRQPVHTRTQRKRKPLWRRILFGALLFLLIANAFLLWRDLTSTHLDLTTIDPRNGSTRTQQDIGSYHNAPSLTAPVSGSSSVFVGVQDNSGQGTQQVLAFTDNAARWDIATQFSAPLAYGALQMSPDGHLFVQSMNALQVWSVDKQMHTQFLWQIHGPQPTRGTHPFRPVSDGQNLYTITSVVSAQIASYDLHTGQLRWSQTLPDTLNYSPPFLIDGQTLYVASDSNIYALKSSNGVLLWENPYPTRTLLFAQDGQTPSIIAVGAKGVLALNPTTGATVWSFTGQTTNTLTSTQFYQATLASTDHATGVLIYTTGIAWQIPQVRRQLWFYAINAHTGSLVWSQPMGTGFISADAGRILTPIVDTTDGIVMLQQQIDEQSQRILAFDTANGALHWSKNIQNRNGSSPTLLRTPDNSLLLFSIVNESGSIFRTFSPWRLLMIQLITCSAVSLLLLWLLPLSTIRTRFTTQLRLLTRRRRGLIDRARRGHIRSSATLTTATTGAINQAPTTSSDTSRSKGHISYRWLALVLVGIVLGTGIVTYVRLNQSQDRILQVSVGTGTTQWQQVVTPGTQPLATNTQHSFVVTQTASNTTQLQSLNAQGQVHWQSFSSEGTFSIPVPPPHSGTVLVTLSGRSPLHYQFAPDDPSYDHMLDSFLALYLFDQASGRTLWQSNAIYPDEQQDGIVLGADTHDIYIASTQTILSTGTHGAPTPTIQLFALNQDTGAVDWRIFGPTASAKAPHDDGKLLLRQGLVIWQVVGIVYAIDTSVGQIAWRQPLVGDSATLLVPEEQQMTFAPNAVVVTRLDGIHALDLNSGNELWHIPVVRTSVGTSFSASASAPGIAFVGHTLLLYGNGEVDAYNVSNQQNLWHHKQLATIQHISISDDGKLAYILLLTGGTTPEPSVAALDIQTGTVDWTFTPAVQSRVLNAYADGFFYSHSVLFVTICSSSSQEMCVDPHLYALDGITGKTAWNMTGTTLSDLHISQDGSVILFRLVSSSWHDMLTRLKA